MADKFKERMKSQYGLRETDMATIDLAYNMAERLEEALFATFQAASGNGGKLARTDSKKAWKKLAQSVIEFAAEKN
jgi:hypothetical protein